MNNRLSYIKAQIIVNKEKILSISTYLLLSLMTFVIALIIKNIFCEWYLKDVGLSFFWTLNYGGNGTEPVIWYIEGYIDARYYYVPYLRAFRFENWNPYSGGSGPLNGYAYGPMFIYWLYITSVFVSLFNPNMPTETMLLESVKWSHISFDALCAPLLYIIITQLNLFKKSTIKKHVIGVFTALVFIVAPFNLFYVDGLWLNIPHMTFFTLLSLFLFIKGKYNASALSLSLAWLSKQMPLFLVIPLFFVIWKKEQSLKEAFLSFLIPFFFYTFLISLPWIYFTPYEFLRRVFGPGKPLTVVELSPEYYGYTVTLAHSLKYLGLGSLATFYANINAHQIPFFFFYFFAVLFSYFYGSEIGKSEELSIIYTTWVILLTHVFIARGVYKYYNAFFPPFILLSIVIFFYKRRQTYLDVILSLPYIIKKGTRRIHSSSIALEHFDSTKEKEKLIVTNNPSRNNSDRIRYEIFGFIMISLGFAAFYGYSLMIIIKSRYLNPLFLLILWGFVSLMLPGSLYRTLIQKEKYVMIKDDITDIIRSAWQILKNIKGKKMKIEKQNETALVSSTNLENET